MHGGQCVGFDVDGFGNNRRLELLRIGREQPIDGFDFATQEIIDRLRGIFVEDLVDLFGLEIGRGADRCPFEALGVALFGFGFVQDAQRKVSFADRFDRPLKESLR